MTLTPTLTAVDLGEKEMILSPCSPPLPPLQQNFELDSNVKWVKTGRRKTEGWAIGCPKKTLFLSIILAVQSLVRMGDLSHQKKFQNYRPINDP